MRDVDSILGELRAAYETAHAVNVRFSGLVANGDVKSAANMGQQLRAAHDEILKLLKEAMQAVERERNQWDEFRILAEERGIREGVKRVKNRMEQDDIKELEAVQGIASFALFVFAAVAVVMFFKLIGG